MTKAGIASGFCHFIGYEGVAELPGSAIPYMSQYYYFLGNGKPLFSMKSWYTAEKYSLFLRV